MTRPVTVVAMGGVTANACVTVEDNPRLSFALAEIVRLLTPVGTVKVVLNGASVSAGNVVLPAVNVMLDTTPSSLAWASNSIT